jgi:hypothetical protein
MAKWRTGLFLRSELRKTPLFQNITNVIPAQAGIQAVKSSHTCVLDKGKTLAKLLQKSRFHQYKPAPPGFPPSRE